MRRIIFAALLLPGLLLAQPSGTIQGSGAATLYANPDQAQITIGVVTDGATAQAAGQSNATQTNNVLNALKQVLGNAGSVQTVSYSVTPRYSNSPGSTVIVGYTATNTLQATTRDLSTIGILIDTAIQAGATNVGGLAFSLRDPDPLKQQALSQAAKQARAHSDAIASGLNAKTGAVLSAMEGATITPILVSGTGTATPTPVQTGQVSVTANVTITVQLVQ